MTQTPANQHNLAQQDLAQPQRDQQHQPVPSVQQTAPLQHHTPQPHAEHAIHDHQQPVAPRSHDQLYEVGYQLALGKLGYKGMQSKIFADAFVGEYQRALENGLNEVLAVRFGAEFAGPFAMAFMHYLSVNQTREEEQDIYGGARAFAEMSFDAYEEAFAKDFAPIHEEKMEAHNLQQAISKALKQDVSSKNLDAALKAQYAEVYKRGLEVGKQQGLDTGHAEGLEAGKIEGRQLGHEEGFREGKAAGIIEGRKLGHQDGYNQGYEESKDKSMHTFTGSSSQVFGDMDAPLELDTPEKKPGVFSKLIKGNS